MEGFLLCRIFLWLYLLESFCPDKVLGRVLFCFVFCCFVLSLITTLLPQNNHKI